MSIPKIIFLSLLSFIISKDLVLIGDSRICGMATQVMNIQYTKPSSKTPNIITQKPKPFKGFNIKVIAEVSASHHTFIKEGSDVNLGVKNILGSAKNGTIVLLWLGINFLDSTGTYNYYKDIATKYKHLKFYAISVSGVVESIKIYKVQNSKVKAFNSELKQKITKNGPSNLKYKSILRKDNPIEINLPRKSITITSSFTKDGLHYNGILYSSIFIAMTSGLK